MRKAVWLAATMTAATLVGCKTAPQNGSPAAPVLESNAPATQVSSTQQIGIDRPPTTPTQTATPAKNDVIAEVGTIKIDRSELEKPLLEAYGFNTLMLIIQRDMAKEACQQQGITVSQADIDNEWKWTLDRMFTDQPEGDRQRLLDQYLAQPKPPGQVSTRVEFGIVIETNAYLRKLAEPQMKVAITDDVLKQAFDERYGAQVRVRHIAVANPQDAMRYKQILENGQDFAVLAKHVSLAPTAQAGGELPPFTINSTKYPKAFKDAAFNLKVGEISEPVAADGSYHIIKLEQKIEPKAVKFDDVKDSLREDLQQSATVEAVKAVRNKLAQEALAEMKISDPILHAEFEKRLGVRDTLIKDREKIRQQLDRERAAASSQPATAPATAPTAPVVPVVPPKPTPATKPAPATAPVSKPAPLTPPAATPVVPPVPAKPVTPPPAPVAPPVVAPSSKPATAPVAPAAKAPAGPASAKPAPAAPATKP